MSYAGDIDPAQTWERLSTDPRAVLVDVRTRAEWTYVGVPDLAGLDKDLVAIEWVGYPDGAINQSFLQQLETAGVDRDAPVFFLCRSGARSQAAASAATSAGWTEAYNVSGGFEGDLGPTRRRDVNGWRHDELPWVQG